MQVVNNDVPVALTDGHQWPLRVYEKSWLKQEKFDRIVDYLGDTGGLDCLDIGSETGAISYLLRARGGNWKSTDHEPIVIERVRQLVGDNVFLMREPLLPFPDNSFDKIVVVDILEHVTDDQRFAKELYRTLRPSGTLILNTPRKKLGWFSSLQNRVGLTNENLGRVRSGYTEQEVETLLGDYFQVSASATYRRFFSKLFESICLLIFRRMPTDKMEKHAPMLTSTMLERHSKMARLYSMLFPLVRVFCSLDRLVPYPGYMLIAKAHPVPNAAE